MKITVRLVLVTVLVVMGLVAGSVAAAAGGMPAAHEADGRTFGEVVSGLAQTDPLALAEHVSGCFGP